MAAVKVSSIEPGDEQAWDDFVRAAPGATFFHLSGWKRVIEKAFGHRTFCRMARRGGTVVGVLHGAKPVASVLNFYFRDEVLRYYGAGRTEARDLAANDFMYWKVMRRACKREFRVFDFGRSRIGAGSYDFKRYWGFDPTPLTYAFRLIQAGKIPDVNPRNAKFKAFIALWRRLPVPPTKLLGPPIVRGNG